MQIPVFFNDQKIGTAEHVEYRTTQDGLPEFIRLTGECDSVVAGLEAVQELRDEIEGRLRGCKGYEAALQECQELENRIKGGKA